MPIPSASPRCRLECFGRSSEADALSESASLPYCLWTGLSPSSRRRPSRSSEPDQDSEASSSSSRPLAPFWTLQRRGSGLEQSWPTRTRRRGSGPGPKGSRTTNRLTRGQRLSRSWTTTTRTWGRCRSLPTQWQVGPSARSEEVSTVPAESAVLPHEPTSPAETPHERLLLDQLPSAGRYYRSFMHRDTVSWVTVTRWVRSVWPCRVSR